METGPATPVPQAEAPRPLDALPDDDLMGLARDGRQDAFAVLVARHQGLVWGLATRFLGDRAAGRDVAQDVFLSLWAERDRYQARGKFRGYLVSATLHRCHGVARTRRNVERKHASAAKDERPGPDTPLQRLEEATRAREVRMRLTELSEKMRLVVTLRYTQELTLPEIAEVTGMPVGTVKTQLFRGIRRLHQLITGEA